MNGLTAPSPFNDADVHWPHDLKIKIEGFPVRTIPLIKEAIIANTVSNGKWSLSFTGRMVYEFEYQACRFSIEISSSSPGWPKRSVLKITLVEWCV